MPHLTPMNWILSLLMIWFFMSMINSTQWWYIPLKFPFNYKSMTSMLTSKWLW